MEIEGLSCYNTIGFMSIGRENYKKGGSNMFGDLDELFDFNGDGKLDAMEQATEYMVLQEFFGDDDKKDNSDDSEEE